MQARCKYRKEVLTPLHFLNFAISISFSLSFVSIKWQPSEANGENAVHVIVAAVKGSSLSSGQTNGGLICTKITLLETELSPLAVYTPKSTAAVYCATCQRAI